MPLVHPMHFSSPVSASACAIYLSLSGSSTQDEHNYFLIPDPRYLSFLFQFPFLLFGHLCIASASTSLSLLTFPTRVTCVHAFVLSYVRFHVTYFLYLSSSQFDSQSICSHSNARSACRGGPWSRSVVFFSPEGDR